MSRYLSVMGFLLLIRGAYAQEEAVNIAPSETVSIVFVILFGVAFVGMIAIFFWYLWLKERRRKLEGKEAENVI